MYYKPHTIQVKPQGEPEMDERGHPIFSDTTWRTEAMGRCDDSNIQELKDANGDVYRPSYHIVLEGHTTIKFGDEIRCINADGSVRGEGIVRNVKNLNYLNYSEIWV